MVFLDNLSISKKVYGGFAIVLALLIIVAITATSGFQRSDQNFQLYTVSSEEIALAEQVKSSLLRARLAAARYLASQAAEAPDQVRENTAAGMILSAEIGEIAGTPERQQIAESLASRMQGFADGFDKVVELQSAIDTNISEVIDVSGRIIGESLTDMLLIARETGNTDMAFYSSMALRDMLIARIFAYQYFQRNDPEAVAKVREEFTSFQQNFSEMSLRITDERSAQLAGIVDNARNNYMSAIDAIEQGMGQRSQILAEELGVIGPGVTEDVTRLRASAKDEQIALLQETQATLETALIVTMVVSILALLVGTLTAWTLGRKISGPVKSMTQVISELAGGNKGVDVPCTQANDEIGEMSRAVLVFKEKLIEADRLNAQQAEEQRMREERARHVEELASCFDGDVEAVLDLVTKSAESMEVTADTMTSTAGRTSLKATEAAGASEQANANVQTVAAAAEELTASIREIGSSVADSTQIARSAVEEAQATNNKVSGLVEAADQIEAVVSLIRDIADQTNMLALNATIEAARSGDAGKGFAVVASEVKTLANQTADATEQIAGQIRAVQEASHESVSAIQSITDTISKMDELSCTIASAIEEQQASTSEIARNVEEAARGTTDVSGNITEVNAAADETGSAATEVKSASSNLSGNAIELKHLVHKFLTEVKAA